MNIMVEIKILDLCVHTNGMYHIPIFHFLRLFHTAIRNIKVIYCTAFKLPSIFCF